VVVAVLAMVVALFGPDLWRRVIESNATRYCQGFVNGSVPAEQGETKFLTRHSMRACGEWAYDKGYTHFRMGCKTHDAATPAYPSGGAGTGRRSARSPDPKALDVTDESFDESVPDPNCGWTKD
jgi:hypothetical protein